MFRKLALALGATAVIAAAALAPTAASAKHWHHHWHGGVGIGFYPGYAYADYCYTVKQVYWTWNGHRRVRYVRVCD